jgi:hypothetical protein
MYKLCMSIKSVLFGVLMNAGVNATIGTVTALPARFIVLTAFTASAVRDPENVPVAADKEPENDPLAADRAPANVALPVAPSNAKVATPASL